MATSKTKKIQLVGQVVTPLEKKTSKNGNEFIRFCLVDTKSRKTYAILGFKSLTMLTEKHVYVNASISLTGRPSDEDGTIIADVITGVNDVVKADPKKEILAIYGSMKNYHDATKATRERYISEGFVLINDLGHQRWRHKDDCILIDGYWQVKIEYLMDKLGPKRVSEEIRKAIGSKGNISTALTSFQNKKYLECRERLLDEAILS